MSDFSAANSCKQFEAVGGFVNRQLADQRALICEFLTPLNIKHESDYFIYLGETGTI